MSAIWSMPAAGIRIVAAIAATLLAVVSLPRPAEAASTGGFLMVNAGSGTCLTGAAQAPCADRDPRQRWQVRLATLTGAFEFRNAATGHCLTGGTAPQTCAGLPARWVFAEAADDAAVLVRSVHTGRCLALAGGAPAEAACAAADPAQQWDVRLSVRQ